MKPLVFLSLAAFSVALGGCGFFKIGDKCAVGPGLTMTPIRGDQLPDKTLALTFDGGPSAAAAAIGDYLYANGIGAAFFVQGREAANFKDVMKSLKEHGHLIANRGYGDGGPTGAADPVTDVRKTDELIAPHVSGDMFLLRTIAEDLSPTLAERLNVAGLTRYVGPIGWDVGTSNSEFTDDRSCWLKGKNADDCAQAYLATIRIKKRGIVRMHAEDPRSEQMLRVVYPKLKEEGFTFVRLDAVTAVRLQLDRSGATPGAVGGGAGCDEY